MRHKISITLLLLGLVLAFIPQPGKYSLHGSPNDLLAEILNTGSFMTADQVARAIVTNDTAIRIFDLRNASEFEKSSLPGAINIPYSGFLKSDLESLFTTGLKNVFYSSDDMEANYAMVLAKGLGYKECFVMKGGFEAWNNDVINSSFSGEKITARENALYEVRNRAKNMFNEMNNMPDSLKSKYRASLEIERKKLDGGCE
jgi:3-mercaptopyruvate sulfurtransferase SseA